jgi:hypothetical protein
VVAVSAQRVGRAQWTALIERQALGVAGRLVAGQIAARADHNGGVRATIAELSACACLPVTVTADAVVDLASRELVARDGPGLVLTRPAGGAR